MAVLSSVARVRHPLRVVPLVDALLALGLVGYAVAASARESAPHPWTELAATTVTASLLLRARAPLAMAAVAATGITAYALLPGSGTPLWMFLAVLVVCFSVGAELTGRERWAALVGLLVAAYVLQLSSIDRASPTDDTFTQIWVSPLVIVLGPVVAGVLLQRARGQAAELRRLAAELELERERHAAAAATAERNRIARELHDVISHAVTVMVVQAGAAEQQLPADSPARGPVHAIREAGRDALTELRRQLAVVRDGGAIRSDSLPGLAELPDLVRRAGAVLDRPPPDQTEVPPGLGLTVYRTVQEALTNARRHAPGSEVRVSVTREGDALEVVVADTGSDAEPDPGSGHGLLGLRERVEMYGGRVSAGRDDTGGWCVRARLPLPGTSP